MTRLESIRRRTASEQGSALIIAVVVLLVVTTLGAAVVAASVQTNGLTQRDTGYKNALEAAEAGLQIALYRQNMLNPDSSHCVGDSAALPGSSGWCSSSSYTLGNGSSYQYYTTPVLSSNSTCAGLPIVGSDVNQRCITAVGSSNGVVARSQIRTAAFTAQPLFEVPGVTGLSSVSLTGQSKVSGATASNGQITLSGQSTSNGLELGPKGSTNISGQSSGGAVTTLSQPIVLAPVGPGNSATTNDDYRIANALASPAVNPHDAITSSQGVNWTASTRSLTLTSQATLQLGGGLYNFCSLNVNGQATLSIAPNVQTEIFIDSPDDPGSGCPSGSGNVSLSGQVTLNPSQNPLALQLYIYGTDNDKASVSITGQANFYGVIYAPQSDVNVSGQGIVQGGIVGNTVEMSGQSFQWVPSVGSIQAGTNGAQFRTAWAQCTPSYSASTPGAGC